MSLDINLENIYQKCRICLKNGDVSIWNCKVPFKRQPELIEDCLHIDEVIEKSFVEILDIFFNSQDLLNFTEEFPFLCWQCLEDLKFCYTIYEKIKVANVQLKNLYQESLNQCIEEEHLMEITEGNEVSEIKVTDIIEGLEEEDVLNLPLYEYDSANEQKVINKLNQSKQITPEENDSFIVTQFIPETLQVSERCNSNNTNNGEGVFQPPKHWWTVNLKAVEVKNIKNLGTQEPSHLLNDEHIVYKCQYCPQAFAKLEYLKTHIQKSHVCNFCTRTFNATDDLFRHIREVHSENKCAICQKTLSSRTNLRHHIKRVHRLELPAKVTLIDFIKSTPSEENMPENEVEILQEKLEETNVHVNAQYVWANDECIEFFGEFNNTG